MADDLVLNSGSGGATIRTLEDGSSIQWPAGVVAYATTIGTPDVLQIVTTTAGLPVQQQTGATFTVTGAAGTFPVTDSGGSLTVDAPVGTPVFVRLSDGSAAISTLPVSLASVPSHAVTNAGTFAVQVDGTALTALQLIDNLVLAEDAAHGSGDPGVQVLAVRKATPADLSGADGDYEPLQMSAGRLWVTASIDGSLPEGSAVIGAVTQSGAWSVSVSGGVNVTATGGAGHDLAVSGNPLLMGGYASAAAPTNVSADGDAVRLWAQLNGALCSQPVYAGVLAVAGNGASGTGVQRVTIANDSTGILAGVTTVTTVTTCSTLTGSGIAHDAADSGNPHKVGAKATTSMAGITLVANADRTDLLAGVDGALIVRPECSLEDVVQERTTNTDGASTAFASGLAAPGAGIRLWVKTVTICNSSASFCTVDLRDGAAGSVLWTLPVPATGGVTHKFDPPLKLTANTALAFDASAAISTLTISANAFKSKV